MCLESQTKNGGTKETNGDRGALMQYVYLENIEERSWIRKIILHSLPPR